ncbi:MAG TPA: phospholipase [Actinoplanes sp.]|nr:phospholipase [Actinoplanes sp.]
MPLLVTSAVLLATVVPAPVDRAGLLASWTQPTAESTAAWQAARADRARWAAYGFDWSTDVCTLAPDTPFGFDFTDACRHHDFGYRNHQSTIARHKKRIDEVFRADLRRICDARRLAAQPLCNATAFTYFEAVRILPRTPV